MEAKKKAEKKTRTVWITKYALTDGIEQATLDVSDHDPGYGLRRGKYNALKFGRDCFDTKAEAIADVTKRCTKKIESLRKQIAKLEKLAVNPKFKKEKSK